MGEGHDAVKAEHSGSALDGVDGAEGVINKFLASRTALHGSESLFQGARMLVALVEEHRLEALELVRHGQFGPSC